HDKTHHVNDRKPPDTGQISLSWPRRQYLKAVAILQDHPKTTLSFVGLALAFFLFYATKLRGWTHFNESLQRWRVESFGGIHHVNRSIRIPDVLLSFEDAGHTQLDFIAPSSVHIGANAFRQELRNLIENHGTARILTLDPRLANPSHPYHQRYLNLAEAFGQKPWEFAARSRYGAAVVAHLADEFGDACEVRFISQPDPEATPPYFTLGRSGHSYERNDRNDRLDIIVPRPDHPTGFDSLTDPADIIVDRPNDSEVTRFTNAFEQHWQDASPLDQALRDYILVTPPNGPKTPEYQP
ncbi:MAG: hypothetical protein AAGD22_17270, partial [Verrucomicrobiota bacterium]